MAGLPTIKAVTEQDTLEQLREHVALLQKIVNYALTGNLSTENMLEISGWQVGDGKLISENGLVGLSSEDTGADDVRIWAGNTVKEQAAFRVYESGKMTATGADISGTIHMTDGEITWGPIGVPDYSLIPGQKPPADADNTASALPSSLGINYTRIGSTYIYTGELNADKINAGTISANYIFGGTMSGDYVSGGTITGVTITGGTISSNSTINVTTDCTVGDNLYVGSKVHFSKTSFSNGLYWDSGCSIDRDPASKNLFISNTVAGVNKGIAFTGDVVFSGSVSGVTAVFG